MKRNARLASACDEIVRTIFRQGQRPTPPVDAARISFTVYTGLTPAQRASTIYPTAVASRNETDQGNISQRKARLSPRGCSAHNSRITGQTAQRVLTRIPSVPAVQDFTFDELVRACSI